ncbi:disintegrin and metalloproteinase domain-containing protein 10-like [Lethenteron reissneri]|uniref:disintegrin and metalloproteinase domain-containing protein 10-like n=1 Tax=Lethenteron reissneri TaxID=7753 RepID=UPI002AB66C9F|nr:disintegrin and metalloproteinase domain-containing protein 10-like [Lethenteron reissneri]
MHPTRTLLLIIVVASLSSPSASSRGAGVAGGLGQALGSYIRRYEGLSYDTEDVHTQHERVRRAALGRQTAQLSLRFSAYGRDFHLRLRRDVSLFVDDFRVETSGVEETYDTSHIYTGSLHGEPGSRCHGSVLGGRFEGVVTTATDGTFYVEPAERYPETGTAATAAAATTAAAAATATAPFHSVIYHEDDIDDPRDHGGGRGEGGGCADGAVFQRMAAFQRRAGHVEDDDGARDQSGGGGGGGGGGAGAAVRGTRSVPGDRNTCLLFIQADHFFHKFYGSREAVIAQIASHVKAIDSIYQNTNFNGIRGINFMVKRVRINGTEEERDPTNPFRFANIGVEKFLELNSEQNHNDYCLAYVFTDRDFDDGVLGLAWVGAPAGSSGGICEKNKLYSDGKRKSLNTGIITVKNYGAHVPPKVSHITFAHEIGHNFGSPHDSGLDCTPGTSLSPDAKERGNFIMYARATSGDRPNNNRFSPCSMRNISLVLASKRHHCFVESGNPICGNGIVEEGEECDCGYRDQCRDQCCHNADEEQSKRCRLRPGMQCSPSQGPCCTRQCRYRGAAEPCRNASECALDGRCDGRSSPCPPSPPRTDFTVCNAGTQVCLKGLCEGSICERYGLEECACANADDQELCHVCCMERGNADSCSSTGSDSWQRYFSGHVVTLQPGAACNDFRGYCDVFSRCRLVDADGPLARLRKAIFDPQLYETIAEWIVAYWWAVLLMALALVLLMAAFIRVCSVHTPTSNPTLPRHKPLPGTLKRNRSAAKTAKPTTRPADTIEMGRRT